MYAECYRRILSIGLCWTFQNISHLSPLRPVSLHVGTTAVLHIFPFNEPHQLPTGPCPPIRQPSPSSPSPPL